MPDPMPSAASPRRLGPRNAGALWLVLILQAGLYLAWTSSSRLWDRDEPRFCRATVEMIGTGDWLVPHFNGELRPDKPILIYWAMAGCVRLLGDEEWVFRLPSVLGMLAASLGAFWIGRRLHGASTGVRAAALYGGGFLPLYIGTNATADGLLIACTTWACALALSLMVDAAGPSSGRRWPREAGLALLLGGAQLAKGPVGLAVPVLAVLLARLLGVRPGRRFWGGFLLAVLAGTLLFVAWGWPANAASGGELARRGLGEHVVERMGEAKEGHGARDALGWLLSLPAYLLTAPLAFFPAFFALPGGVLLAWRGARRRREEKPQDEAERARRDGVRFLLGWALGTYGLMSLIVTKLPHYVLPASPALAVLMAAHWPRAGASRGARLAHTFVAVVLAIGLAAGPLVLMRRGGLALAGAAFAAELCFLASAIAIWRGRRGRGWAFGLGVAGFALVGALLVPQADPSLKAARDLARVVRSDPELRALPVHLCGYGEPSVVFYCARPAGETLPSVRRDALSAWLQEEAPALLVTSTRRLREVGVDVREAALGDDPERARRVLFRKEVRRYSRGFKREEVILYRRGSL